MVGREGGGGFPAERLARLAALESWHFWFVGRRDLIDRLLDRHAPVAGQRVLDLGCGTGRNLELGSVRGWRMVGLDARPEGLASARLHRPSSLLIRADATRLPLRDRTFEGVLLLDVLEHADEGLLLAEVERILRPRGWAVVLVPALPSLWSYRDRAAGHLRRYTRRSLTAALAAARLQVVESRYYQCLLLPLVWCTRMLGRGGASWRDLEERPAGWLNRVLTWINRCEVASDLPWPCGSSLVAVCRRS
jgi:ubiquinone/menaquinone biosynthesis C-methylase UbiE